MSTDDTSERDIAAETYALASGYKSTYDRMRLFEGYCAGADWGYARAKEELGAEIERAQKALQKIADCALETTKQQEKYRKKLLPWRR